MNDKELYQHKKQTQLNEWKTGMIQFRTQAFAARTHLQLELNKHVKVLEGKLDEGKIRLAELVKVTGSSFEPAKKNFEIMWDSITVSFADTATKFKTL